MSKNSCPKHSLSAVILFIFMLSALLNLPGLGNKQETKKGDLDTEFKTEVISKINKLMIDHYIFLDKAEKMRDFLNSQLKEGKYKGLNDVHQFARALRRDLIKISNDRHIQVVYDPARVERIKAGKSQSEQEREKARKEQLERDRQQNFGFQRVELRDGNIGYLDLRSFTGQPEAFETIVAAMNFLANSNAVIIDLRNNGGGDPYTIQIISSYFLKEYTHLNSFEYRGEDIFQQFWTLPGVPGKKMYDTDLYILTSRRTFSAAEEFTYNLKNLKRATIVGETTRGGAHPGGFRIITDNFLVWLPDGRAVNPITKTNWEGTGIEPHIKVDRDKALDKAHALALEKLLEKTGDESKKFSLQWGLDGLKSRMEPAVVDQDILKKYVGSYTRGSVTLEKNTLHLKAGPMTFKMIPVSESYFILEGETNIRVRFERDSSGENFNIIAIYADGNEEKINRIEKKEM